MFGFKILFVISLISLYKIRNRPSQIHCLNSDGTGDLSLLRYKADFVTSLFAISELYCIILQDVFLFLAHLAFRPCELLSSLFVRRLSSVVHRPSTFHILIFSSETTGPIATKLWWNGPWMAPFQNCVW